MQVGVPYTMGVRFCQALATLKSVAFLGSKYLHNMCETDSTLHRVP